MKVKATSLCQSERTYTTATPKILVKIGNTYADAMLDSGVKINVMRALADKVRVKDKSGLSTEDCLRKA